jgi:hypothetical protein
MWRRQRRGKTGRRTETDILQRSGIGLGLGDRLIIDLDFVWSESLCLRVASGQEQTEGKGEEGGSSSEQYATVAAKRAPCSNCVKIESGTRIETPA